MLAAHVLAMVAASAILGSAADLKGTWSATAGSGYLAGSWTAQPDPSGGATGAWMLQDATGKILMQGGWSASKICEIVGWRVESHSLRPLRRILRELDQRHITLAAGPLRRAARLRVARSGDRNV